MPLRNASIYHFSDLLQIDFLARIDPPDRIRLLAALAQINLGEIPPPVSGIKLSSPGVKDRRINIVVTPVFYQGRAGTQFLLIDPLSFQENHVPINQPADEVLTDVMAAFASTADLNQTLEHLLVNLRKVKRGKAEDPILERDDIVLVPEAFF